METVGKRFQCGEYFLPELNKALGALAWPLKTTTAAQAPIDLTMATTVLQGNQLVTTDAQSSRRREPRSGSGDAACPRDPRGP